MIREWARNLLHWNQAPSEQRQFAGRVRGLANGWDGLSRSDVVARSPILIARNVETFLYELLAARADTPTHGKELLQIGSTSARSM